jgi:hypothetical protein
VREFKEVGGHLIGEDRQVVEVPLEILEEERSRYLIERECLNLGMSRVMREQLREGFLHLGG